MERHSTEWLYGFLDGVAKCRAEVLRARMRNEIPSDADLQALSIEARKQLSEINNEDY